MLLQFGELGVLVISVPKKPISFFSGYPCKPLFISTICSVVSNSVKLCYCFLGLNCAIVSQWSSRFSPLFLEIGYATVFGALLALSCPEFQTSKMSQTRPALLIECSFPSDAVTILPGWRPRLHSTISSVRCCLLYFLTTRSYYFVCYLVYRSETLAFQSVRTLCILE